MEWIQPATTKKPSITFLQWFARGLVKLKYVEPGGVQQIL